MNKIIKAKNIELNRAIEDYVEKKLNSLAKFIVDFNEGLVKAEVEVSRTTRHHQSGDIFRAEINLSTNGRLFRAESEKDDLFAAIDEVRDDLEQEIRKFKTKKETIFIRGARSLKKKIGLSPLARFRK